MLNKYLEFLDYLMGSLNKYFEAQTPYIKCKRGCAKCCSNGDYPFSQLEVGLLKLGFQTLDKKTQNIIRENIKKLITAKLNHNKETVFTYECPFLLNNECSLYLYRGIICRTFGLIYIKENAKQQIPFCAYEGLNYSDILDKEKDMLMPEKMRELGIEAEPKAYNIHYDFLTSDKVAHAFEIEFGKRGPLIDLLIEDEFFNPQ